MGYIDKNKKELYKESQFIKDLPIDNSTKDINNFICKYSNTNIVYNHFKSWLLQNSSNKNIEFSFNSVELAHLDDTDGI